jgi:hypothetical protein
MLRIKTLLNSGVSIVRTVLASTMSDVTGPPRVVSWTGTNLDAIAAINSEQSETVEFATDNCRQTAVNNRDIADTADDAVNQSLSKKALKRVSRNQNLTYC